MSITLDQVTKRYDGVAVVNDVSLSMAEGEFLVLLGPSGSGKSTLLRAIAGLTQLDHGRVSLHGRDVTGVTARKRGVGFVFQHYALFQHMSVAANIEFALRVRGIRASARKARRQELLKLVALEGMDERLPGELSGGQQQRVAVARALAHEPKVLLMDEPFGALDAKIREELRRTIRQIQRELGIATILVTHDQEEAFALADRIGVMHQGRMLECGPPEQLYSQPATRFVANFLGAANLLLGYRTARGLDFERPAPAARPPREVVAVLRPEEVEVAGNAAAVRSQFVCHGEVAEVLFGGSVERLRIRLPADGPLPVANDPDGAGALVEVARSLPERRLFPVHPGQRVAIGARRAHILPTPVSSFTVIAPDAAAAAALRATPLLAELARRMQTRVSTCTYGEEAPQPGMNLIGTGPGCARVALSRLQQGTMQLLCLPPASPAPARVVIFLADDAAQRDTFAVAASLVRHLPAEALYLDIYPDAPEAQRVSQLRRLLDSRSAALADHGLDVRTESRPGNAAIELAREIGANEATLLILGVTRPNALEGLGLAGLVEGPRPRPVLVVHSGAAIGSGGA